MLFDARVKVSYEVFKAGYGEYIANIYGDEVVLFSKKFGDYKSAKKWASTLTNILKGHVHA